MKVLSLALLLVATTSANAATLQCAERASDAFKGGRLQYAVAVETARSQKARVSLFKRDPRDGSSSFTKMIPPFEADATSQGGIFHIDAMKAHGLKFTLNLSVPKAAYLELRWVRGDVELVCK